MLLEPLVSDLKEPIPVKWDSLKNGMLDSFEHGKPRGTKTYFEPLDLDTIWTWAKGKLYCITGHPGHGKSEFLQMLLILKSIGEGTKYTIYSPESYPVQDFVDTLIHTLKGQSTDPKYPNQMAKSEYIKGIDFVEKHFHILDYKEPPSVEDLIYYDEKLDTDALIIDPFNAIDNAGLYNIHDFLKVNLTKLKNYAVRSNKMVILIEHPSNSHATDDEGNIQEPSQYTINGGAMWRNKVDFFGVVHRPNIIDVGDRTVTFRSCKIKNQKLYGSPGMAKFRFNIASNRYEYTLDKDGGKWVDAWNVEQIKAPF